MNTVLKKEIECSTDYVLPDYLGDIRKVLSVRASAIPAGKFVSGGDINMGGIVGFEVLYTDADGRLGSFTLSADYDASVPVVSDTYIDSYTDTRVVNYGIRLTGPRKLTARAGLRLTALVKSEDDLSVSGDALTSDRAGETLSAEIKREEILVGKSHEREFADAAEHTAVPAESIEILTTSGFVRISEAVAVEGGASVKGTLIITALVKTDDGMPFAIKKTIPFDETVEIDGAGADMQVMADGIITSVSANAVDDGEGSSINVSVMAEFSAIAARNETVTVISDGYLRDVETAANYGTYKYSELLALGTCDGRVDGSVSLSELGLGEPDEILSCMADVRISGVTPARDGFEIEGEITVSAVACQIKESDEPSLMPVKFTVPLDINVNCGCQILDDGSIECRAWAADVECALDGERLSVECVLSLSYRAVRCSEAERLVECSAVLGGEYPENGSSITVYYPEDGETLFKIAKRFHRTVAEIAADNEISLPASGGINAPVSVKKLIIR